MIEATLLVLSFILGFFVREYFDKLVEKARRKYESSPGKNQEENLEKET